MLLLLYVNKVATLTYLPKHFSYSNLSFNFSQKIISDIKKIKGNRKVKQIKISFFFNLKSSLLNYNSLE